MQFAHTYIQVYITTINPPFTKRHLGYAQDFVTQTSCDQFIGLENVLKLIAYLNDIHIYIQKYIFEGKKCLRINASTHNLWLSRYRLHTRDILLKCAELKDSKKVSIGAEGNSNRGCKNGWRSHPVLFECSTCASTSSNALSNSFIHEWSANKITAVMRSLKKGKYTHTYTCIHTPMYIHKNFI